MHIMSLLLDLSNIVGGFLLALALLRHLPRVGGGVQRVAAAVAPFGWIVGIVTLVAGGFFLVVHAVSGPHLFHYEVVGIAVGIALLWDRLTGRETQQSGERDGTSGLGLALAIFGLIAIVVGIQGLFTPDG